MSGPLLFSPVRFRGVTFPNRIMLSPMCQYTATDGVAGQWHLVHLGTLAKGGFGGVMIEATAVSPEGRITHGDLGLWSDAHAEALGPLVETVRKAGARPGIQLGHAGRKASMQRPWFGNGALGPDDLARGDQPWEIVGASPLPVDEGWLVPRELDAAGIAKVVEDFAAATQRAVELGLDFVEIHAAHGYLIHQFLSEASNRRTDAYGGDLASRMRFAREVIEAVRRAWPQSKPLFMRISAKDEAGWSLADSVAFARMAGELGVDLIDCSSGGIAPKSLTAFEDESQPGYQVPYSSEIRSKTGLMTMAVGLIREARHAEAILQAGDADLIAIGREMLYNPAWTLHAAGELGLENRFDLVPPNYRHFLARRDRKPEDKLVR